MCKENKIVRLLCKACGEIYLEEKAYNHHAQKHLQKRLDGWTHNEKILS